MDLRDRLTAANLATERFRASDGRMSIGVRTREEAADIALGVVAAWLRNEARDVVWDDDGILTRLADFLTGSTDGT
jgi:hypothetical protein